MTDFSAEGQHGAHTGRRDRAAQKEIPIECLVKGFGVELKPTGSNLVGRYPFHDERTPSLIVTPITNL